MKHLLTATILSAATLLAQTRSPHRRGPHGLEGWTLNEIVEGVEGQGPLPVDLVLARNGRVIRRISDGPFIWKWIFLPSGRQVAYETGPLHFGLSCVLVDINSGKRVADYDCFHGIPDDAPRWLDLLENTSNTASAGARKVASSKSRPARCNRASELGSQRPSQ